MFDLLYVVQCLCMSLSHPFCYMGNAAVNARKGFNLFSGMMMPVLV